jgi:ParB-like chromosome segregation protein Spo0J
MLPLQEGPFTPDPFNGFDALKGLRAMGETSPFAGDFGVMPDLTHIADNLRPLAEPIAALHSDPHNARRHSPRNLRAIAASLRAFGQQKPIVAGPDGVVLAGNGTLEAARTLGWSHVAVVRSTLAAAQGRAFALADNRTAELAEWDHAVLAEELAALAQAPGLEATVSGFSRRDIAQTLAEQAGPDEGFELPRTYQVVVECRDEAEQRRAYDLLQQAGLSCRVLTL